jgi:hypothetical protein
MGIHRRTRALATRERSITPLLRRLGTIRHADFRRNDDAYVRSNPYLMAKLEKAMRDIADGRFIVGSLEEA